MRKPARLTVRPSSCCTASLDVRAPGTAWFRALAADGCRVLVPWLRGYGRTRFLDAGTPRSGQQAALGADLRAFMAALGIERATLAGYDWGGRAACIMAALWPERVRGLVSITGYNIQNIAASGRPADAEAEYSYWYQWYFHTERGRAGLAAEPARHLPPAVAPLVAQLAVRRGDVRGDGRSFDNPDFVDVVIHSYRHRYGNAPGDPALADPSAAWLPSRRSRVPTIVLHGAADGVRPASQSADAARHFTGAYERG